MRRSTFIILHSLGVCAIAISLLTGLRIATVDKPYFLSINALLPSGQVHQWHLFAGSIMWVTIGYYGYQKCVAKRSVKSTLYHHWVTLFGYISIMFAAVSGTLLFFDRLPANLTFVHFYSALSVVLYLLLHSWIYLLQLGRVAIKRVLKLPIKQLPIVLIFIIAIVSTSAFYALQSTTHTLQVMPIAQTVLMDVNGKPDEPHWQQAEPISILTTHGANFENGQTQVEVRALSNQEETFFLFKWADPTQSLEHLPLVKTENGWHVKESGFYYFDEQSYYEDKFAVMLSRSCQFGADNTSYLGKTPLTDKPSNWHGKGYHASLDGKIRDLWHWKAVRTNNMILADDNFIGPPAKVLNGARRYTAGYQPDGKESGAYVMNWLWYSKNGVTPKRLPEKTEHEKSTVLPWFGSTPYKPELDNYSIGTKLSSVLYRSNRFEGDRAHVRAKGHWQDGFWTLELVRKNNTQSPYDIPLNNRTCLWVSAFDHSQIAHTRHQRAIKLRYSL